MQALFQYTHPVKGATQGDGVDVSIHAPVKGATPIHNKRFKHIMLSKNDLYAITLSFTGSRMY
jgi:hypothetical protein